MHQIRADVAASAHRTTAIPALDTPAAVVDLAIVQRNIERLQAACDRAGVANRPHIKTHKVPEIARMQIAAGAKGITCQKLGEAEVMADAGLDDILISYNIIGEPKYRRLVTLAAQARITVSCDNQIVAAGLSKAMQNASRRLRVLVECDTGRQRCGVETVEDAINLAGQVAELPGLSFAGFLTYPPNGPTTATADFVAAATAGCRAHGLEVEIVSSGGTPNQGRIGETGETEYRAGTYVYNDRQMVHMGAARPHDCALFVYSTVVSHPASGRLIVDAGSKALTSDLAGFEDFGVLVDYPGARIYRLAEEHGFVDVSACARIPQIGEIVRILPNHVCPVSNLFDTLVCTRAGILDCTFKIAGRGKVA